MQPLESGEPRTIGPYRLLARLGSGGMGRVYLGRSTGGRTVAVKAVHPHLALDREFRERFRREVAAARRVGGPWTAPVLDADPEAPVPWVATGYVAGPPLSRAVSGYGALPEHSVRVLGAGLAGALTAVHARDLIHRDVKPSNVLLTLDGPRLIDFGIARTTDGTAPLTSTGVSVGSPGYISPEQLLGKEATTASDVFSLGAVLAYAANGEAPFPAASSGALVYSVVHDEPRLGSVGGELRELIAGCLAKDPADRPTLGELADGLVPDGASGLSGAGWLPPPLVEQAGRAAVSLLELDTEDDTEDAEAPEDAEVPESTESTENGGSAEPRAPEQLAPGRRRISCSFTLTLTLAALGVIIGSVLMSRHSGDSTARGPAERSTPTKPSFRTDYPGDIKVRSDVPPRFVGEWAGTFTASAGGDRPAAGTLDVVIGAAEKGFRVGVLKRFDADGDFVCGADLDLRLAEKSELVARSTPFGAPGGLCATGTVILRLEGAGLRYVSTESKADHGAVTLERVADFDRPPRRVPPRPGS
ncbi:serine/threonine-protein kinase [Streptomyces katsurahamanus]|uniref:Serine/threonine protein kinase n=1 Tax=Streptomyces katsurahamanus TaxID=2577098 RepID=A0ABW9NY43_9ACTN|nr:serine/threonine-protein kinase [Streptomyces katsurahamanus]MQS38252.1 serine/threonine protein kinase [Streptomyces katsurahamanus]